jgi:limonene 1,2-monooxygenase
LILYAKEWGSREAIWRSYELFARYVMPHFQKSLIGLQASAEIVSQINHQAAHHPHGR